MFKSLFISILVAGCATALLICLPTKAFAACDNPTSTSEAIKCGSNSAAGQESSANPSKIDDTVRTIINLLSVIIGTVAVIMIMLAGFRYITSGGSSEQVASAKNALIYAIIGLVIVALAQVIARFTLHAVTSTSQKKSSYVQLIEKT